MPHYLFCVAYFDKDLTHLYELSVSLLEFFLIFFIVSIKAIESLMFNQLLCLSGSDENQDIHIAFLLECHS